MEIVSTLRDDKHELRLVVIKLKYVRGCPSIDIAYT